MSIAINAGDVKRNDSGIGIDPENIIIDEGLNGRKYPHTEKEIQDLAENIREFGQKQAVQVRRVNDNRVQMVLGIGRWKAVNLLNQLYPDQKRKLQCVVIAKMTDEEALIANIAENEFRVATTVIDKAYCQNKLRTEQGWADTRIAALYRCEPSYVGKIKKLLDLPEDVQLRVAKGDLSVDAALALLELDTAEDRAEVIAPNVTANPVTPTVDSVNPPTATANDGSTVTLAVNQPTSAEIIERVRNKKIDKGGRYPRNLANVRKFLKKNAEDGNPLKPFADTFLKFIGGYYKDGTMEAKLRELLKVSEAASEAA